MPDDNNTEHLLCPVHLEAIDADASSVTIPRHLRSDAPTKSANTEPSQAEELSPTG